MLPIITCLKNAQMELFFNAFIEIVRNDRYLNSDIDQVINAPIRFTAPVWVGEVDFQPRSTFNGLSSASLFSDEPRLRSDKKVHVGDVTFSAPIDVADLRTQRVNQEDWGALLVSLAWTNTTNHFHQPLTFDHLTVCLPIGSSSFFSITGILYHRNFPSLAL